MSDISIRHYDSLDSTNEEARRLAQAGERGPLWIVAREQTAGRGRYGRQWASPAGNLFSTVLLRPARPADVCAQLSFAAALAAADAVASFAPQSSVTLKWPNDVLLQGRKVAGILLESSGGAHGRALDWLAVGTGINLMSYPREVEFPAVSLAEVLGHAPEPEDALQRLATCWSAWYETWMSKGFAPVREAWLGRAIGLGERVSAQLAGRKLQGVFEGLAEDGTLILREAKGEVTRIAAGEVYFRM